MDHIYYHSMHAELSIGKRLGMNGNNFKSKGPASSLIGISRNEENDDDSRLTGPNNGVDDLSLEGHNHALYVAPPSPQADKQELLELKRQLVTQKAKRRKFTSKLRHCKAEIEALKAERAVMVDKLAHANIATDDQPFNQRGWFSKVAGDNGGSIQMLVNANAKLMLDNARLEVSLDVLQKSFHSYIRDSSQYSNKDTRTLKPSSCSDKMLASFFTLDEEEGESYLDSSQRSIHDEILKKIHNRIPERELDKFGTSGDKCIIEDKDIEDVNEIGRAARERRATGKGVARKRTTHTNALRKESTLAKETRTPSSQEGAQQLGSQKPRRDDKLRRQKFLREGGENQISGRQDAGICKFSTSETLLVEFDERPRARGVAKLWSSLKW